MKTKPSTFYLTEFPKGYREPRYYMDPERADKRIQKVREKYGVQGKVVKVKECK